MLRASGFATGLFVLLWGVTFLWVDKLVLFEVPTEESGLRGMLTQELIAEENRPVIDPADWTAFSLMSVGSVAMLYAVALPKRR